MARHAGWPRKAPGAVRIWLDAMKAYVDSRSGSGQASEITGLVTAGNGVTITGRGTAQDAYVVNSSAAPGTPVPLTLNAPATPGPIYPPLATPHGDGMVRLSGTVHVPGPIPAGDNQLITTLVAPFVPLQFGQWPALASFISTVGNPTAGVSVQTDGLVYLILPEISEGNSVNVSLDGITYWPASA